METTRCSNTSLRGKSQMCCIPDITIHFINISARTVKLGTHTSYGKRTTPINLQGQGQRSRLHASKGETITRVNGKVLFFAGKRLHYS